MNIRELCYNAYDLAVSKGWYRDGNPPVAERFMLIVSEVSEALEEWRAGHGVDDVYIKDGKPEGVPIELADAVIRIADFCAAHGIDLESAITMKMAYNATRSYRHGGKVA